MRHAPRVMLILAMLLCGIAAADMRSFVSRYYHVHTDLPPGVASDLAKRLDLMHEEYARRMSRFIADRQLPRGNVYLFARQEDYLHFAGEGMRSTGGVYIPSRNALAAFHDGQGRNNLRRTLQHEAFHQFAANAISRPLPMWVNEGLAQLFEEGLWTGDGFSIGQVPPWRLRQLRSDIRAGRLVNFDTFMKRTPEQWAAVMKSRSLSQGATQYNQAWAMVHFLVNSTDEAGNPRFRARFIRMLELIHQGLNPDLAFRQAFSGNIQAFRQHFDHWAATLQPTPEAIYLEHQEVLADMLVAMHESKLTFKEMEAFRQAVARYGLKINYSRGQIRWSTDQDTDIYFSRLDGSLLRPWELYFQPRRNAPLPDIVCTVLPNATMRTRFYRSGNRILHELVLEPARHQVGSADRAR